MATLGYGIYLVHIVGISVVVVPLAVHVARHVHLPWQVLWPVAVASAFGLASLGAYALHFLVEKPALKLRDRLSP